MRIVLIMVLSLLAFSPASASPVNIVGVGEVDLSQDIKITQTYDKKGATIHAFTIKDGKLWRGALLMPIEALAAPPNAPMIKLDALLNHIVVDKFRSNANFLEADNAKLLMLKGKECAMISVKITPPSTGIVGNLDIMIIPSVAGYKMFGFMCADSDAQYWRPIMQKIAANIS